MGFQDGPLLYLFPKDSFTAASQLAEEKVTYMA